MERGNVKTHPSCVTRDVTVQQNVTKEKERKSIATIMVCVTMTRKGATLCGAAGNTFSPCTASQNSRGFGRRRQKAGQKRGLTGKEVKDINAFIKNKIKETIKERNRDMH
eukprot:9227193-Ditylum_brightwellii.AAC.1